MTKAISFDEIVQAKQTMFSFIDSLWEQEKVSAQAKFEYRRTKARAEMSAAVSSLNPLAVAGQVASRAALEAKIIALLARAAVIRAQTKFKEVSLEGTVGELSKGKNTVQKFDELSQKWDSICAAARDIHSDVNCRAGQGAPWKATNNTDVDYENSVQTQSTALDELAGIARHNSNSSDAVSTIQSAIYSLANSAFIEADANVQSVNPDINVEADSFFGATLNAEFVANRLDNWFGAKASKLVERAHEPACDVRQNLNAALTSGANINRGWPERKVQNALDTEVGDMHLTVEEVDHEGYEGDNTNRDLKLG